MYQELEDKVFDIIEDLFRRGYRRGKIITELYTRYGIPIKIAEAFYAKYLTGGMDG